jgi:uronate dehydrogenase
MAEKKKVLITGAAGRIGRVMRQGLAERYSLRLTDRVPMEPLVDGEEAHVADLNDLDAMERVATGMDAVVHLGGNPSMAATWEEVLEANIKGTYSLYEAAKRAGVACVVFASSNHATGFYEQEGIYTTPDMPERPDTYYGVSKAFGEDMGRYYVDAFGLRVFCLRIGSFVDAEAVRSRKADRILSTWLSQRDAVQLVWRCIEAEQVNYGIFYGISDNKRAYWDTTNARELVGYAPEDDAERLA